MSKYIITGDPPTANGDLHIGHLSGPYFAADVVTRHLRRLGHDVAFFSNADPHQTYVEITGRRMGITSQEVIDYFEPRILSTLANADISVDLFGDQGSRQQQFTNAVFEDLVKQGVLVSKEAKMAYCVPCERFLYQAYIEGSCPHCSAHTFGNNCESCGIPNDPSDIGDPLCRLCGESAPEQRSYRGFFLPLERHIEGIRAGLEANRHLLRPRILKVLLNAFERDLPDIPASIPSPYGLPVKLPGYEGQTWNVRLEVILGLISTFDVWRDQQGDAGWDWRDHEDVQILHFHGIDNIFQYAAFFTAVVTGSELCWPKQGFSITNEFCLLNGQKFSTTRNYAIWGNDILAKVSSNHLRFYLAWINPELEQADFVLGDFIETTNRLLVKPWNEVVNALCQADASADAAGTPDTDLMQRFEGYRQAMDKTFELATLSLRRAAQILAQMLEDLTQVSDNADGQASLRAGVEVFVELAEPVLPRLAKRLNERSAQNAPWDPSLQLDELLVDALRSIDQQPDVTTAS